MIDLQDLQERYKDKDTAAYLFNLHEETLIALCKILDLNYLKSNEEEILKAVRKLKEQER